MLTRGTGFCSQCMMIYNVKLAALCLLVLIGIYITYSAKVKEVKYVCLDEVKKVNQDQI